MLSATCHGVGSEERSSPAPLAFAGSGLDRPSVWDRTPGRRLGRQAGVPSPQRHVRQDAAGAGTAGVPSVARRRGSPRHRAPRVEMTACRSTLVPPRPVQPATVSSAVSLWWSTRPAVGRDESSSFGLGAGLKDVPRDGRCSGQVERGVDQPRLGVTRASCRTTPLACTGQMRPELGAAGRPGAAPTARGAGRLGAARQLVALVAPMRPDPAPRRAQRTRM